MKQTLTVLIDSDELADWCLNGVPGEVMGSPPHNNATEVTFTWEEPNSISPGQEWKIKSKTNYGELYWSGGIPQLGFIVVGQHPLLPNTWVVVCVSNEDAYLLTEDEIHDMYAPERVLVP